MKSLKRQAAKATTKLIKRPSAKVIQRPAAFKKPTCHFMPVRPKRGQGLRAMKRPESRDHVYTKRPAGATKVRRDRLHVTRDDIPNRMKTDQACAQRLVTLGLLPMHRV
eukprot:3048784-Amphidinium_carterae.1